MWGDGFTPFSLDFVSKYQRAAKRSKPEKRVAFLSSNFTPPKNTSQLNSNFSHYYSNKISGRTKFDIFFCENLIDCYRFGYKTSYSREPLFCKGALTLYDLRFLELQNKEPSLYKKNWRIKSLMRFLSKNVCFHLCDLIICVKFKIQKSALYPDPSNMMRLTLKRFQIKSTSKFTFQG